ncbi:MAG: hypothetical protein H6753_00380 [Candidatus Omnitrophica bacterium]|nr:hypothetical protein [Candidatus Omnitrophota bacterium]
MPFKIGGANGAVSQMDWPAAGRFISADEERPSPWAASPLDGPTTVNTLKVSSKQRLITLRVKKDSVVLRQKISDIGLFK